MEYAVSPAVSNVEAWSNREGDTVWGTEADRFTPEVVTARFIKGTACRRHVSRLLIPELFVLSLHPRFGSARLLCHP